MGNTVMGKRQTVVLLRWVLIIAFSYLLLLDAAAATVQPRLVLLIAVASSAARAVAQDSAEPLPKEEDLSSSPEPLRTKPA